MTKDDRWLELLVEMKEIQKQTRDNLKTLNDSHIAVLANTQEIKVSISYLAKYFGFSIAALIFLAGAGKVLGVLP